MANEQLVGNYDIIKSLKNDVGAFIRGETKIRPLARGIVMHWTAGGYRASNVDLDHYHYLVEPGAVLVGKFNVNSNRPPLLPNRYAEHTAKLNDLMIGVSMTGMFGAVPNNLGRFPLTKTQWDTSVDLCAELCHFFNLPVTERTVLGHCEVARVYGRPQGGKWDPWTQNKNWPWTIGKSVRQIGDEFRFNVEGKLEHLKNL